MELDYFHVIYVVAVVVTGLTLNFGDMSRWARSNKWSVHSSCKQYDGLPTWQRLYSRHLPDLEQHYLCTLLGSIFDGTWRLLNISLERASYQTVDFEVFKLKVWESKTVPYQTEGHHSASRGTHLATCGSFSAPAQCIISTHSWNLCLSLRNLVTLCQVTIKPDKGKLVNHNPSIGKASFLVLSGFWGREYILKRLE